MPWLAVNAKRWYYGGLWTRNRRKRKRNESEKNKNGKVCYYLILQSQPPLTVTTSAVERAKKKELRKERAKKFSKNKRRRTEYD